MGELYQTLHCFIGKQTLPRITVSNTSSSRWVNLKVKLPQFPSQTPAQEQPAQTHTIVEWKWKSTTLPRQTPGGWESLPSSLPHHTVEYRIQVEWTASQPAVYVYVSITHSLTLPADNWHLNHVVTTSCKYESIKYIWNWTTIEYYGRIFSGHESPHSLLQFCPKLSYATRVPLRWQLEYHARLQILYSCSGTNQVTRNPFRDPLRNIHIRHVGISKYTIPISGTYVKPHVKEELRSWLTQN